MEDRIAKIAKNVVAAEVRSADRIKEPDGLKLDFRSTLIDWLKGFPVEVESIDKTLARYKGDSNNSQVAALRKKRDLANALLNLANKCLDSIDKYEAVATDF